MEGGNGSSRGSLQSLPARCRRPIDRVAFLPLPFSMTARHHSLLSSVKTVRQKGSNRTRYGYNLRTELGGKEYRPIRFRWSFFVLLRLERKRQNTLIKPKANCRIPRPCVNPTDTTVDITLDSHHRYMSHQVGK